MTMSKSEYKRRLALGAPPSCAECGKTSTPDSMWALYCVECAERYIVNPDLLEALTMAQRLCREVLPKINWGASFFDANAVDLLNRVPAIVDAALTPEGLERPVRQPLTVDQIVQHAGRAVAKKIVAGQSITPDDWVEFARNIERAHGIGVSP